MGVTPLQEIPPGQGQSFIGSRRRLRSRAFLGPQSEMSQTNPFGDPDERSPLSSASSHKPLYTNDYNPFAEKPVNETSANVFTKSAVRPPSPPRQPTMNSAPPMVDTMPSIPPPPYVPPPQPASNEISQRQQELDRRAAELVAREKQLNDKKLNNPRANNWPPLPKCCPKPCFFQNFEMDILPPYRRTVRCTYYLWIAYSLSLVLNVLFCMAYFISASQLGDGSGSTAGIAFGFSLLWLVLFVPMAFVCWYRPLYNAFRTNSSINFFLFFIVFVLHIICSIVMTLGIGSSGFVGWISVFTMVGEPGSQKIVGGVMAIMAFIFTIGTVVCIVLFIKVVRSYRNTGASFEQAQKDFAQGVLKNQSGSGPAPSVPPAAVPAPPPIWPPPGYGAGASSA